LNSFVVPVGVIAVDLYLIIISDNKGGSLSCDTREVQSFAHPILNLDQLAKAFVILRLEISVADRTEEIPGLTLLELGSRRFVELVVTRFRMKADEHLRAAVDGDEGDHASRVDHATAL